MKVIGCFLKFNPAKSFKLLRKWDVAHLKKTPNTYGAKRARFGIYLLEKELVAHNVTLIILPSTAHDPSETALEMRRTYLHPTHHEHPA